jgi:Pyruvate/2-oxoacid:ferredoxin oxidoreductase gamma subunit
MQTIKASLGKKEAAVMEKNIQAFKAGMEFAEKN